MYRVLSVFLITIITIISLNAIEQDLSTAEVIAGNFLTYKSSDATISASQILSSNRANLVYIFGLEPDGFIAMSADNDVYPIIAYSFRNNPNETGNIMLDILPEDVSNRSEYNQISRDRGLANNLIWDQYYAGVQLRTGFEQWPAGETAGTDGWVETTWNQSGVYNQFCPLDNSGVRSVVGCAATTMAMIMDFHRYIGNVSFSDADDYYTLSEGMHIDDDHEERDYPAFPELNEYLEDLIMHYQSEIPITDEDKAALSFAVGVSVEMDYSSFGSGASEGFAISFIYKFGYDNAEEVEYEDYDFFERMQENMIMMRPVGMVISTNSSNPSVHSIVVDGNNTDDYYHLNYGWGTSNSTCWYSLPEGMPSGYTIIIAALMDIEGGTVPVEVFGNVMTDGISPVGTEIYLEGERYSYHFTIEEETGSFTLPAVLEGNYSATASLTDRIHYQHLEDIYIDADNNTIQFQLGNFDAVTGEVTAPVNVQNCHLVLYQENVPVYEGTTETDGSFSIPDVLPGIYTVSASMSGNYYAQQEIEITLENQTFDMELEHYNGEIALTYSTYPEGIWSFIPDDTLACAIKLNAGDHSELSGDILSQIRFKCPIAQDGGAITAQIWEGNLLIAEKEVTEFYADEWITCDLENYILLDSQKDYYVGYTITSENGAIAYHDNSPRVLGKGAFIAHPCWIELPPGNFDFNFCIEAVIGTQEFGVVSGNVILEGGDGNILDVCIKADDYTAHPDEDGNYQLPVKYGEYDLSASLSDYNEYSIVGIVIDEENSILVDQNIELQYGVPTNEDIPVKIAFLRNYPNPFNPSTRITFSLTTENTESTELVIYNIKGQKIRKYSISNIPRTVIHSLRGRQYSITNDQYSVTWDGTDDQNKPVCSGVYLYKLKDGNQELIRKMVLMK